MVVQRLTDVKAFEDVSTVSKKLPLNSLLRGEAAF